MRQALQALRARWVLLVRPEPLVLPVQPETQEPLDQRVLQALPAPPALRELPVPLELQEPQVLLALRERLAQQVRQAQQAQQAQRVRLALRELPVRQEPTALQY